MSEECKCSRCGHAFVPSPFFDFYPTPTADDPNAGLCERCEMEKLLAGEQAVVVLNAEPVRISNEHSKAACKEGQGEAACSFLAMGAVGLVCLKCSSMEANIRNRLREDSMRSKGDNCSGPPDFLKK